MLQPGGVYDAIADTLETRSIDIEPLTLFHLAKLNPETYNRLWRLVVSGKASLFPSTYSHPILPLLASENFLDAKINVRWSLQYILGDSNSLRDKPIFFWLSECAYSDKAGEAILAAIHEVYPSIEIFLLLDEFQGENIDPSHLYRTKLENGELGLAFRSRWVSDAYAFSQDAEWLTYSLRADILRRKPEVIGATIDAETYGGAYSPNKPFFFARIRERLSEGVSEGNVTIPVQFLPVDQTLQNANWKSSEAKLIEDSSWSNYFETQLLNPKSDSRNGILARKLEPLCRWTGLVHGKNNRPETYFLVFDWTDPRSKKTYTRVISSLWKVAFNTLRSEGSDLVRRTILEALPSLIGKGTVEEALASYGEVIFEKRAWSTYSSSLKIDGTDDEQEAAQLLLEAYRMANQEASMSDSTYWENIDTEVTWTALALLAAGIIQAAKSCLKLGKSERFEKLAKEYKYLFLDFESSFTPLLEQFSCPLDILYNYLKEQSWKNGYDLEQDLASGPIVKERSLIIAKKAYEATFNKDSNRPLKESDVNPYLILWKMKEHRGTPDAIETWNNACIYEWKKSISSSVSKQPIPVRVGLLHAKHFPRNQIFNLPVEDPDTSTELISGETHAYV